MIFDLMERVNASWNRPLQGRYHAAVMPAQRPIVEALDLGFEHRWIALPEPPRDTLAINQIYEARVSILPKSFIVAFSAYSQQAAGYNVKITDLGSRTEFFSQPIRFENLSGQAATPEGVNIPQHLLPQPRIIMDPGILSVSLENLAATTNQVQFVLWIAEPPCRHP